MPKIKNLWAKDLLEFFQKHWFLIFSQRGSHIKLKKVTAFAKQILTIPNHKELDRWTLKAIMRQASSFISIEELEKLFYTE